MLQVSKVNEKAILPNRAHADDAGLDLFSCESVVLKPGLPTKVKTGISFAIPIAYVGLIRDRSSMGSKGISVLGGVIDSGYRGEVQVILINLTKEDYQINIADKIAQILIMPVSLEMPKEVHSFEDLRIDSNQSFNSRGSKGFGSSGR
ncbi:MAG: dUTP diphosphatase [Bacteriovoracia bacterium]